MFNLYQTYKQKDDPDKELDVTGHDRFCQMRPSTSGTKKKKFLTKRSRSAAEFSNKTLRSARRISTSGDDEIDNDLPFRSLSISKITMRRRCRFFFWFLIKKLIIVFQIIKCS